tara:strand:- start:124 stop:1062 length:939 start_codon:yes stop_codon:yes gene_type:complete
MIKKTIGIIGPGNHFEKNIISVLKKNKFFKIKSILRNKSKKYKNYKTLNEVDFFKEKFDFVYISCPNKLHEKYIIKSLKSGSHVICEKPFLTSDNKLKDILILSKKNKKLIFETFMYLYHPLFYKLKKLINEKKRGKLRYVVSNFRFPSLNKDNQRYKKKLGDGFFYDAAVYQISVENYLFNNSLINKKEIEQLKIRKKVDLKGYFAIKNKNFNRFYFWGEGQNYTNNIEFFFNNSCIYVDRFFSKLKNQPTYIKIFENDKIKSIKFNGNEDHFENMFYEIFKNYKKLSFQNYHRRRISNQIKLINTLSSIK